MSLINRFTNILQNAVEALAPQASSMEEFTFHWKRITNYYIETSDEKEPVSRTNIPAHLEQMLEILIAEELELIEEFGSAENQTGPCLEHLLHQNILETLTTFGRGDTPPGMKQQVLHFATTLLGKIKQPLLPHVNVHKPVIKLVAICGEVMAAPTEKEEVHFLCVVCSKIKLDPYQVNFFVQAPTMPNIKRKSPNPIEQIAEELDDISVKESELVEVDVKSLEIDTEAGTGLKYYHQKRDEFLLAEGLLNLTKSPDQKIAVKACEGLMLLVGLPEAKASKTLVECTQLANFICCKLSKLIAELPLTLDPADVESTEAKWGLDSYSAKEDKQAFTGKRQLRSFLSFLDFIDTLIEESHRVIGSTLAEAIKIHVFDKVLKDLLLATNENTALSITAVLTKIIQDCKSQYIIQQLTQFMLGDEAKKPEEKQEDNLASQNVRQTLIARCDHISDELAITTLRLFEVLLQKTDKLAIENLISRNLVSRGYVAPAEKTNEADEEPTSEATDSVTQEPEFEWDDSDVIPKSTPVAKKEPEITAEQLADPKKRLEHMVNLFLSVVPENLRSSYEQEELGHEQYLRDAHTAFRDAAKKTKRFNWPAKVDQSVAPTSDEFFPGSFTSMLMNKLSRVLDQPYDINLQVTSVVSRFCLVPHVYLTEYALDPLIKPKSSSQTLYSTLQNVVKVLETRAARIPNFRDKLVSTRKRLIGMEQDFDNPEHRTLLEGVIVLEEFCKEVAAVAFVKHHAASSGIDNLSV